MLKWLYQMGKDPTLPAESTTKGVKASKQADLPKSSAAPRLWVPLAFVLMYQAAQEWYVNEWTDRQTPAYWSGVLLSKPIVGTVLYLSMIFGGQKFMASREPSPTLRKYIYTYNMYQVCLNAWCVYIFVKEAVKTYYALGVNPLNLSLEQTSDMTNFLIWVHYNNKFVELFDTFFMVMNKKTDQLSFLHVYHHVLLMWSWFAVCRYGGAGGIAWFSAMLNSLIHVLMYSYYLLAAMKVECPWKKVLTKAQMLQFVACMSTALHGIYHQLYPFYLSLLNIWVMLNMLVLFGNFYRKRYATKPGPSAPATAPKQHVE
jgi:elongation of very long chain fatty acids protein 4